MKTISATKARKSIYKLIDEANESKNPFKLLGKEAMLWFYRKKIGGPLKKPFTFFPCLVWENP